MTPPKGVMRLEVIVSHKVEEPGMDINVDHRRPGALATLLGGGNIVNLKSVHN